MSKPTPRRRIIRSGTDLLAALARTADGPSFCRNCGDPFDTDAENAAVRLPSGAWRPCPNPSPGRPMIDCGVGGHMYDRHQPGCN